MKDFSIAEIVRQRLEILSGRYKYSRGQIVQFDARFARDHVLHLLMAAMCLVAVMGYCGCEGASN
jgi:hypothetical protein